MYKRYYEKEKEEKEGLILLIAKRGKKMAGYTGTKKKKKKTKGAPGSGTRATNIPSLPSVKGSSKGGHAGRESIDRAYKKYGVKPKPGSGTRKGKATRTAHGKQGQADIGKALKKGFNKVGELVKKGGDWLEKGNEGKPSPYIGLEKSYKTKEEWRKDQKKKK